MLEDIIKERKRKLENLQKDGINSYPAESKRTALIGDALKNFLKWQKEKKKISFTGRIKSLRDQGGLIFVGLEDVSGRIQIVIKKDNIKNFKDFKNNLDLGDFIETSGSLFVTKRKERSLESKTLKILTKSLRPIPTDYFGLGDIETRLRKRYLDLLVDPELKKMFVKKALFWKSIRDYLEKENFTEVETPVLETTPGGADAEPFTTHHNALNEDFYLRISLEISLKKLLVAGFEKIFEIGRVFRNEGIDAEHLQDYAELEFYWAYADYNDLMKFTEKMFKEIIKKTFGVLKLKHQNKEINWGKKWETIDYFKIFKEKTKIDLKTASQKELLEKANKEGLKPKPGLGKGRLIDLIYKKLVRPSLIQPCFLIDPPVEIEPLAKRHRKDEKKVERFQILACGTELGKGFTEANDPIDQRERFKEQMNLRNKGDKEAQRLDEDFLEALEYGMPPAAGFGLSERLFSILTDKPIRETIFFPPMRKK